KEEEKKTVRATTIRPVHAKKKNQRNTKRKQLLLGKEGLLVQQPPTFTPLSAPLASFVGLLFLLPFCFFFFFFFFFFFVSPSSSSSSLAQQQRRRWRLLPRILK